MKSNLKQDLENFRKDFASDINILEKRVHSLQQKLDTYIVPRLQHHDNDLIDLKNKIGNTNIGATLDSDAKRISALEDWRNSLTPKACGYCKWIKIVRNEDQQTIGICNNPKSIQYNHEVLAEENCFGFVPKPEIVVEELEDDSK